MASSTPAAPAATATTGGTELKLCLRRTGVVEHHEFVLTLPEGLDKQKVIEEFEDNPDYFWQVYNTANGMHFGEPADRTLDCGAVISEHFESETLYDYQEIEVIED